MENKSQIAYTQYIKVALDRVRELKEQGHDVSEANRILQSIVAAVIENDYNCADFLINELENVFKKIEHLKSPALFNSKSDFLKAEDKFMGRVVKEPELEPYHFVVRNLRTLPETDSKSKMLIGLIYVFLFLFVFTLISLIYYLLRFQGLR